MAAVPPGRMAPHRHGFSKLSERSSKRLRELVAEHGYRWAVLHLRSSDCTLRNLVAGLAVKASTVVRLEERITRSVGSK